jgi:hypothetical protein
MVILWFKKPVICNGLKCVVSGTQYHLKGKGSVTLQFLLVCVYARARMCTYICICIVIDEAFKGKYVLEVVLETSSFSVSFKPS